jgi:acyl dehydratase
MTTDSSEQAITRLFSAHFPTYRHSYTKRDVALYALGVGCGAKELRYVYEGHELFAVLPTFATTPAHAAVYNVPLGDAVPGADTSKGLHAEHYIELPSGALPPAAETVTRAEVVELVPKPKGALAVVRTTTVSAQLGHVLAVNEFTTYLPGAGGFQTVKSPTAAPRAPAAVARNAPPAGVAPDCVATVPTSEDQAALYRLSGDYNPLHIDPEAARRAGGFEKPILHGLCTLGVSARAVLEAYGGGDPAAVESVKARFSAPVVPGDALEVAMWALPNGRTVVFETRVARGGKKVAAITGGGIVFRPGRRAAAVGGDGSSGSGSSSVGAAGVQSKL